MDEMKFKLSTRLMRGILAKIISKLIFKKLGVKTDLRIYEIDLEVVEGRVKFHLNMDGEMTQNDLLKVTKLIEEEELD